MASKEGRFLNLDFFYNWSHDLAWVLGYAMADGNISLGDKSNPWRYALRFNIGMKDRCVLDFLKEKIKPDASIYHNKIFNKRVNKNYETLILCFYSKELTGYLAQFGLVPRKTGKECIKNIPDEYLSAFIRGFTDGDGSWHYNEKASKYVQSITSSSIEMLESIKNVVGCGNVFRRKTKSSFNITNMSDVIKFGTFIYKSPGYFLERKKNTYNEMLECIYASNKFRHKTSLI